MLSTPYPVRRRRSLARDAKAWLAAVALASAVAASTVNAQGLEDGCQCGIYARRAGEVVAERSSDQRFTPASVQKLVVAATALHHLGPDYQVVTEVHGRAPDSEGTVAGDLTLLGRGDPTWNDLYYEDDPRVPLRALAEAVARRGVKRVSGDLVIDGSLFPGFEVPPDWPVGDLSYAYGSVPSALAIDANTVRLRMAPGVRVGAPARASIEGDVDLLNRVLTVSAERHGKGTVEFQLQWDRPRLVARGEFPISEDPFRIRVASPRPLAVAGLALQRALVEAGVEIGGDLQIIDPLASQEVRRRTGLGPTGDEPLVRFASLPLSEWLEPLLADSNNWTAEMTLRVLALEKTGAGRLDGGLDLERELLEEIVGVDAKDFVFDDGSGLSPFNLLTPRATVQLLEWASQQEWFSFFREALASAEQGTLARSWGRVPALRAKTGSLRSVQTLAGYDESHGGAPVAFAVFVNGSVDNRRTMKSQILSEIRSWRAVVRELEASAASAEAVQP